MRTGLLKPPRNLVLMILFHLIAELKRLRTYICLLVSSLLKVTIFYYVHTSAQPRRSATNIIYNTQRLYIAHRSLPFVYHRSAFQVDLLLTYIGPCMLLSAWSPCAKWLCMLACLHACMHASMQAWVCLPG
jgi:hypothetical protein